MFSTKQLANCFVEEKSKQQIAGEEKSKQQVAIWSPCSLIEASLIAHTSFDFFNETTSELFR